MARSANKIRKHDLRDLVNVYHTAAPQELFDSLSENQISTEQAWAKVAEIFGNQKAATEIRILEAVRKREQKRGR